MSVVGRIVYAPSADVQRIISSGNVLLDVSAQMEMLGEVLIYCNDEDLSGEVVLGEVFLSPANKEIFYNYILMHETTQVLCVLNCSSGIVIMDYYYEIAI